MEGSDDQEGDYNIDIHEAAATLFTSGGRSRRTVAQQLREGHELGWSDEESYALMLQLLMEIPADRFPKADSESGLDDDDDKEKEEEEEEEGEDYDGEDVEEQEDLSQDEDPGSLVDDHGPEEEDSILTPPSEADPAGLLLDDQRTRGQRPCPACRPSRVDDAAALFGLTLPSYEEEEEGTDDDEEVSSDDDSDMDSSRGVEDDEGSVPPRPGGRRGHRDDGMDSDSDCEAVVSDDGDSDWESVASEHDEANNDDDDTSTTLSSVCFDLLCLVLVVLYLFCCLLLYLYCLLPSLSPL